MNTNRVVDGPKLTVDGEESIDGVTEMLEYGKLETTGVGFGASQGRNNERKCRPRHRV